MYIYTNPQVQNDGCSDQGAQPLLVSLVLPRFARTCTEAWAPRSKRRRVTNQAAVAALAWQPGLLLHELPDPDGVDGGGNSAGGDRSRAAPYYPIFVRGIAGFPAPLLRLDLGCEVPTVGTLRKLLIEVTGTDFEIAFGQVQLGSARQYLHRIGMLAGSVVCVAGLRQPASNPAQSCASSVSTPPPIMLAVEIDDHFLHGPMHDQIDTTAAAVTNHAAGQKCAPVILAQRTGTLWSGSSRKRMLSTGEGQSLRGPAGQPSLLASQPGARITHKAQADSISCPHEDEGGF